MRADARCPLRRHDSERVALVSRRLISPDVLEIQLRPSVHELFELIRAINRTGRVRVARRSPEGHG